MKEKSRYKLRQGVILQLAGSSEVYTNDNLTDKIAKKYLQENPSAEKRFEIIPSDDAESSNSENDDATKLVDTANTRIAELEAENEALRARITALEGLEKTDEDTDDDQDMSNDDDTNVPFVANPIIREAIAAELAAGKTKTAVKAEFAGREIEGVKLTHRLVAAYIKTITE